MRLAPALLLLLAAALFVAACGDDDAGSDADVSETPNLFPSQPVPQEQPDPAQELDATLTEPVDGVIEVALQDILFSPNNLHVPLGEAKTGRQSTLLRSHRRQALLASRLAPGPAPAAPAARAATGRDSAFR